MRFLNVEHENKLIVSVSKSISLSYFSIGRCSYLFVIVLMLLTGYDIKVSRTVDIIVTANSITLIVIGVHNKVILNTET